MADDFEDDLDLYDDMDSGGSSKGKSGGGSNNKIVFLVILLVAAAGGYYYFNMMDTVDDEFSFDPDEVLQEELELESEQPEEFVQEEFPPQGEREQVLGPQAPSPMLGRGDYSLLSPRDGAVVRYDESRHPPQFKWTGAQGRLIFSRRSDLSRVQKSIVSRSGVRVPNLYPGTWYWTVKGAESSSSIRSLVVQSSRKRNIIVQVPQTGGSLSGSGGEVRWIGDERIAYYKVELTKPGTEVSAYRFATSGTSLQINNVESGSYQLKVGGFSEVSGKWEFSSAFDVNIE